MFFILSNSNAFVLDVLISRIFKKRKKPLTEGNHTFTTNARWIYINDDDEQHKCRCLP